MGWDVVDSSKVPGGDGVLTLHRSGDDFTIFVDHRRLMDSRVYASEVALAELAIAAVAEPKAILVGGLGMGFTLRAALDRLPDSAAVVVAELVPAVVRWNQGPLGVVSNRPLDDPRVVVRTEDVGVVLASRTWDVILFDVDNGPEGITRTDNDHLYAADGLRAAFEALNPGGALAVWSAKPDDAFTERLEALGFQVRVEIVHSGGLDRSDHVIWIREAPLTRYTPAVFVLGCLGVLFPRLVLVLVWLFGGGYIGRAFDTVLWPVLGFFFLPLTTLAFVYSVNSLGGPGMVPPLGWVLIGLAALSDLGLLGNGERARRRRGQE